MDKKSKILITALILIVVGSIFMTYRRTLIEHDFSTEASEFVEIEPNEDITGAE